jgi:hypothetical protein
MRPTTAMRRIILVIEKGADNTLWGRVSFEGNLVVDSAPNLESLKRKIKIILHDFHRVESETIQFEITHDAAVS